MPAAGSRKTHSKSRNGCGQCKRRRVRCNLEPPICSNCQRRGEQCEYLSTAGIFPQHPNGSENQQSSSTALVPRTTATNNQCGYSAEYFVVNPFIRVPAPSTGLSVPQPDIISWIFEHVWLMPGITPAESSMWRGTLTRQADKFHYLEPSATSILHLYQSLQGQQGSAEIRAHAYQYNIKALNLFLSSHQAITEQNWLAVMGFGVALVIFHFGAARLIPNSEHDHLGIFHLLRRTARLIDGVIPFFKQSQLRMFVDYRESLIKITQDEELWRHLQRLDSIEYPDGTEADIIEACCNAITVLKGWVREIGGRPHNWKHFWKWPGLVSDQFVTLLMVRHPGALLIFIYWCAIMDRTPKRWFLEGWAPRDAHLAMAGLDASWGEFLEWPRKVFDSVHERQLVKPEQTPP